MQNQNLQIITADYSIVKGREFTKFCADCVKDSSPENFGLKLDMDEITGTIIQYVGDKDKICLVAYLGKEAVGIFMGNITKLPFTKVREAGNYFFRVEPEYRGKGVGTALLAEFEGWAKKEGADIISLGIHEYGTLNYDGSVKALGKMGYRPFSANLYKRI